MKHTILNHYDFHNTLLVLKCVKYRTNLTVFKMRLYKQNLFQVSPTTQKATQTFKSTASFILVWHQGSEVPNHNCFFLLNKKIFVHWIIFPLIFFGFFVLSVSHYQLVLFFSLIHFFIDELAWTVMQFVKTVTGFTDCTTGSLTLRSARKNPKIISFN